MPRKAKAALCRAHNAPVVVETIAVDAPKRGEVTVKLGACGVCHSDLSAITGTIALPLPLVLGHEGAGVVEEVGEGVSGLAKGDHVVFSFIYMCGKCRFCVSGRPVLCLEQGKALTTPLEGTPRAHDAAGKPLNIFSGCGTMAEYATVSAENLIRIDPKIPMEVAALVGCAVTTGVGAVFNTAKLEPGSTAVVFGCGGVGLSAIQGARIAGAERVIAAREIDDSEIVERCVYAMVNEGARILEEGIALRAVDIDIVYVHGYGFPQYRGGPMYYADEIGIARVRDALLSLGRRPDADYGYWRVAPLIERLADDGGRFNDA